MTWTGSLALFAIMATLAAIPSSSVLLVVARSASGGVRHGVAAAAGVAAGDLVFMTMAVLGMTALAGQTGAVFVVVKYMAGLYLIWFGIGLIRSGGGAAMPPGAGRLAGSLPASFASGLLLTLGDIKAIFFYASLLPTVLDLASLTAWDIAVVSLITVIAVGGVKAGYAMGAGGVLRLAGGLASARPLKVASGGLMAGAGAYLLLRE